MSRPTYIQINTTALLHNIQRIKTYAPGKKIIAMVKANAYGLRVSSLLATLEGQVDALGVACLEEAMNIRKLGSRIDCVLFQGVFNSEEYQIAADQRFQCVIHHQDQINWLLETPLNTKLKVWIKINTGMHRLGFEPKEACRIYRTLSDCSWVDPDIGLMTHLARADEPAHPANQLQLAKFNEIDLPSTLTRSIANSAAIISLPQSHADVVRPGIMLYGISPFAKQTGQELGLKPVIQLLSAVSAIHQYPANAAVGYGGIWKTTKPTTIATVPIGYGDGYPRHIKENTPVWVNGEFAPIVGRISMDMLTINLGDREDVQVGDRVELWGEHVPVEEIAKCAGTIPYELICQMSMRVRCD